MDDLAAVWLNKQLLKNLEELEEATVGEGKRLTQKKSKDGISILEAFDVVLEEQVAAILARDISFLAPFKGKQPQTAQDFIRFSGGLNMCIEKLINYRIYDSNDTEKPRLQEQKSVVIDYVDVLEQMLVKAKGRTPQKPSSDKANKNYAPLALPFCALCFRRVYRSPYYCMKHHSSRNANAYKQAIRRLMSAVYRHSNDLNEQTKLERYKNGEQKLEAKTLYRWLDLFAASPTLAIKDLNKLNQDADAWQAFAQCILDFASKYYPHTFTKLPTVSCGSNLDDWLMKTVKELGGQTEVNMWQHKDADVWMVKSNLMQKSLTLLNCLSRYESMCVVENFEVKTGSKAGSQIDVAKHAIANKLLKEKETNDSITYSFIAKKSGLSRTTINKIAKKMKV
ncbi:hypothetical protein BCT76_16255 [Vibrio tasmaniensis]|uniref:hypothetical protein n=1 Tax=Vibrio tasmaniensis TaxID=212663 RepID=UPI000C83BDB3|nr:hypothetical protein [Vibrio tasmaniensis]PML45809.1 hypothetical protein BCT76_16255 [Vibrio tasmaniensis]